MKAKFQICISLPLKDNKGHAQNIFEHLRFIICFILIEVVVFLLFFAKRSIGINTFNSNDLCLCELNSLSANPTKWPNTHTHLPKNCLSVFDHFVILALKGLNFTSYDVWELLSTFYI